VAAPPKAPIDDNSPELPRSAPVAPSPGAATPAPQPTRGAATWYRTDQVRYKSVRRRANPWYRRLGRGLIALCLLGAVGVGLYFGARAIQDYVERDRLPGPGADVPAFRKTGFLVQSSAPAPTIDGTIVVDTRTGAFEYTARANGTQSGLHVVSPDGVRLYVRRGTGAWRVAGAGDAVVADVRTAIAYLKDVDSADDLLVSRLRNYVDLVDLTTEGVGEDELRRYEMTIDTAGFSADHPLQWSSFRRSAIPGVQEQTALPVTMWLDNDNVLTRLQDDATNWSWQRVETLDEPFRPFDPDESISDATPVATTESESPAADPPDAADPGSG
jgi:hypothetical protein